MAEIDVIGVQSVCALIEQIGLKKFTVSRPNTHKNSMPVFECLKTNTVDGAIDAFKNWSSNMLNGSTNCNAYELVLFDTIENVELDESDNKKKRAQRVKFTFALSAQQSHFSRGEETRTNDNKSVAELVQMAVANAMAARDNQDLKKEIDELRARLDEEEEEEEEEEENNGSLGALAEVNALLDRVGMFGNKKETALAGTETTPAPETKPTISPEQIANINKAVKILCNHDARLDQDLLKLAAVAEGNPKQFAFLLNALRNM